MGQTTHGPSLRELLMRELEAQTRRLLEMAGEGTYEVGEQRGHCLGLAYAVAVITNPYVPDMNAIRQELMERINR